MTNEATTPSGQPLGISHKPSKSGAMFTKFKAENKPAFIGYLPTASLTRTSRCCWMLSENVSPMPLS